MSEATASRAQANTGAKRCLFLAPMKPPDHPNPSGDRMIARQFLRLLNRLGISAYIPSVLRTRCATPEALAAILAAAEPELARCLEQELARPVEARADFIFTYHNYYKAPDLIGPGLARALDIPYVIAESSRAPVRANGPWAAAHERAEAASDAASLILTPTVRDAVMLERLRPVHQRVIRLKPFIDLAEWPGTGRRSGDRPDKPVRLLCVAMMRPGVKIQSYALLASALHRLGMPDWTLDIIGDGEGRPEVEALFAGFGGKVRFHGAIEDRHVLGDFYANADLFVWPGVGEAIGMVYLEAQAHGLPCLAYGYGGVADAVADGISGFLVPPDDEEGFVGKLGVLIGDAGERQRLHRQARQHVERFHSLEAATGVLADALDSIGLSTVATNTPADSGQAGGSRRIPGNDEFDPVLRELDRWHQHGRQARLWLRDDDAHEPGENLGRLLGAMRRHHAHCLIAVIPMRAGEKLAARLAAEPLARIAVHGFEHRNNAPEGRRAEEMAPELGMNEIRSRLAAAREKLVSLFGESAGRWYVPPWNRIAPDVAAELPDLGFSAISTFAGPHFDFGNRLVELNTHVDFINWKGGRIGHEAPVIARKLADELAKARQEGFRPVGLLTHHLQHDETVWTVLEKTLELVSKHPGAGWHDPDVLLTSARNAL